MSNPLFVTICLSWGALCSAWGGLLVAQHLARRRGLMLRPIVGAPEGGPHPSVTVIVPARDEQEKIESCLKHILAQDYPDLSIILVDDRSTDDTAAIARRLARADRRLGVEYVERVPDGWLAKSHALWWGAWRAPPEAEWLLFIDADCTMHRSAVRTAVAEAARRRVEALTLWPRNAAVTFWEHLLIPLCAGIIALWFGSAELGRSPRRRTPFANGQFLLIRRSAYERIGGHAAVRAAIIEDIPLAERAAEAGVYVHVASGRDLLAVRMYTGLRPIFDGWSRIFVGALREPVKLVLSIAWLAIGSLLPHLAAPVLLAGIVRGPADGQRLVLALLCLQHLALIYIVSYRFWGMGRCRRRYLWLYPVSVVLVIAILARALWLMSVRREICWRQTRYALGARGTILPG